MNFMCLTRPFASPYRLNSSRSRYASADSTARMPKPRRPPRATELPMDTWRKYRECSGRVEHEAIRAGQLSRTEVRFFSLRQSSVANHVLSYGSEEQKHNWRPRISAGKLVGTISMVETPGGSDLRVIKTFASQDGNEYVMNLRQLAARVAEEPVVSAHK